MRVTILPDDNSVSVDGEGYGNLDLSFMDATIHAVQWYGTHGEVERKDPVTKRMTSNEEITSFDQFQQAITLWQAEKDRVAAEIAAAAARKNIPVGGEPNVIAE
jgi:hypothetical protein